MPHELNTPPRLWPFLLASGAAAIWIDFGAFHQYHTSDSLLPVLVSLQHWTPFFWLQDRVGMLAPLVALPLRHPLGNLLLQDAIYIFSGLAAFFLLARYLLRDDTYAITGIVSATAFLALAPPYYVFDFFANTFYGVWLALGLGGLVVLEPDANGQISWLRGACALVLLILAHWAYSAAAVLLGPLIVFRALFAARTRLAAPRRSDARPRGSLVTQLFGLGGRWVNGETGVALTTLASAFMVGFVFMKRASHANPRTLLGALPVEEWPGAWKQLALNAWAGLAPYHWPYFLITAAGGGICFLGIAPIRQRAARAWRAAAALSAAGLVFSVFLGTQPWLAVWGRFAERYTKPSIFLVQMACIMVFAAPLCRVFPVRVRRVGAFGAPCLVGAAFLSFGMPSLHQVRADLDRRCGAYSADLLACGCSHFAGNYWRVWPSVFHANLLAHEQHERRMIWGVTYRGEATWRKWRHMPPEDVRVALPADGDAEAIDYLKQFGFLPLTKMERRQTISLVRPLVWGKDACLQD
jgi:hypothetical protein